jgi:hypothetical protein
VAVGHRLAAEVVPVGLLLAVGAVLVVAITAAT